MEISLGDRESERTLEAHHCSQDHRESVAREEDASLAHLSKVIHRNNTGLPFLQSLLSVS